MGGAVSMLTAMFIIFSALSMGVTERQRVLAMLRAVGAERGQVFRLILLEGVALSIAGIGVGIPLGMAWMELLYLRFPDFFAAGALFSAGGMLYAAGGSMLTALAAGLLPGWWASRISPLEAMSSAVPPPSHRPPLRWALLGLVLTGIDPFLFFGPIEPALRAIGARDPRVMAESVRFFGHFIAGLPGIMLGFFLLAPTFVWIMERLCAPVLAAGFTIPVKLLRQQLSTGIWRAAGTAAALMVGLATLVAMQTNGHTLIGGWQLPTQFPDIFIWAPDPISWKEQKTLAKVPGIEPGSLMPIVVTTQAGDSKTALFIATALAGQNVGFMFFAVDPDQAIGMIQLDFRDADGRSLPRDQQAAAAQNALQELKKGRRVIVTDEFRQARDVKVGDTIPVQTALNGAQNYTICGIVWSPGVDVIISMFDLGRVLDQQTAGSVFGTIDDAKRDFGVNGARLFAANLQGGIDKDVLLKNVQRSLGDRGLSAGDVRHIKYAIEHAFYQLLNLISTIAIAAMAVASLGVANTIMASIRSRRWQFGILRGIGLERGDLLRIILAEATLLGIVGVALGIAAGLEISVDDRQFSGTFLGYSPDLQIPWHIVGGGSLALLVIAIVAGLWPAVSVARAQPLDLLQAGRAST
jgi:putative ABC transport system permease protein